ncbi:MAG TPA: hypothetical protein DCS05_09190 [Nitrospiraceae bacterium]|nr:hypothetical protein [Nitrospiraceae bacterium]
MTTFDMWLWIKLDDIRALMGFAGIVCAGAAGMVAIWHIGRSEAASLLEKFCVTAFVLGSVLLLLSTALLPSTKQAAAIMVVPPLLESRAFMNDIPELYGLSVDALKDKLAGEVQP